MLPISCYSWYLVEYFMVIGYLFHFNCLVSYIDCVITQINTIYDLKYEKWWKNRQKLKKLSIFMKKWSIFYIFPQNFGQCWSTFINAAVLANMLSTFATLIYFCQNVRKLNQTCIRFQKKTQQIRLSLLQGW